MNSWLIQKAIFAALDGAGIATFDEIPEDEGTETPYVVIGETTEQPDDTHEEDGSSETVLLHIWSRDTGSDEVKAMMSEVDDLLHHAVLTLTGGATVFLTRLFAEVLKEELEAGETWRHGLLRYRVRTLAVV